MTLEIITKAHWRGWNDDDQNVREWARTSSDENLQLYAKRLESLRSRLSERNYKFFKQSLHDGRLIAFSVGDGIHINLESQSQVSVRDFYRTAVEIKVLNARFDSVYTLRYGTVTKCVFDFPSDDPLWGSNIDDWGYDEISEVNGGTLRHEILFSSGTTVLIEFEKFTYTKKKVKGSRYPKG